MSRSPTIRQRDTAAASRGAAVIAPAWSTAQRRAIRIGSPAVVLSGDALALLSPLLSDAHQVPATVGMALASVVLVAQAGRYRTPLNLSVLDDLPAIVGRLVVAAATVATMVGLWSGPQAVATFLGNCAMVVVLVAGGRVLTARVIRSRRERGEGFRRTLMVGGGALTAELVEVLDNDASYGLAVVGYVGDGNDPAAPDLPPWLGRMSDVDSVVRSAGTDTLIVTPDAGAECALPNLLRAPECLACDIFAVPRLYHLRVHPAPVDRIGSVPVVRILRPRLPGPWGAIKRATDIAIAGLLLALLWPVVEARRVGTRIRTAARPTEDMFPQQPETVRRLSGVVRGDLSLVGRTGAVETLYECDRPGRRTRVGLTGLAQINDGYMSVHERVRYDSHYVENWSPWLDMKTIGKAIARIIASH